MAAAEEAAVAQGVDALFVLTTQARDWFVDLGFEDTSPDRLPQQKQSLYNWQRNAKVLMKSLAQEAPNHGR